MGKAVCMGAGDTWELSVLPAQLSCEPKTALEVKFTIKQKIILQALLMACCNI